MQEKEIHTWTAGQVMTGGKSTTRIILKAEDWREDTE